MPTLIVDVIAARNMAASSSNCNPQVKVIVRKPGAKDAKKCKTKVKKKTKDPVFKESFTFRDVNHGDELILECWHMGSKAQFLGQVFVSLDTTVSQRAGKLSEWMALRDRGKSSDGEITGDIFVELLMSSEASPSGRSSSLGHRASLDFSDIEESPPMAKKKMKFNSLRGTRSSPFKKGHRPRTPSWGGETATPPGVDMMDKKFGASSTSVTLNSGARPVLGVPLEQLMEEQQVKHPTLRIPVFVHRALAELEKRQAYNEQGIFRIEAKNDELSAALSQGAQVRFSRIESVHTIAGVLKIFFRELPEPVMSYYFYDQFVESIPMDQDLPAPRLIKRAIEKLPEVNFHLLRRVIKFMSKVIKSESSKMDSNNLSIVWGPNLLWREKRTGEGFSDDKDLGVYRAALAVSTRLISFIIDEYQQIFPSPAAALDGIQALRESKNGEWVRGEDGNMYMVEEVVVECDERGQPIDGQAVLQIEEIVEEVIYE